MARIFISYATSDRMLADEVSRWLRAEGQVIGVVTSSFIASNWCSAELGIADALGCPLLPLRAEDDVVHPLMPHLQYVDYLADPEQARDRVLQAVRLLDGGERKRLTRAKISLIAVLWSTRATQRVRLPLKTPLVSGTGHSSRPRSTSGSGMPNSRPECATHRTTRLVVFDRQSSVEPGVFHSGEFLSQRRPT